MPTHTGRNSGQSSSPKGGYMWKSFACQISNVPDMSIWGDRKGTLMTCITFALVKNFPVNEILSANYLCCILYSYAAQIYKSRGEKSQGNVFFYFQNKTTSLHNEGHQWLSIWCNLFLCLLKLNVPGAKEWGFFFYLKSDAKVIVLLLSSRYFNNIQRILLPCSFTEATVIKLCKQWSKMEVQCFRRFMTYPPCIKKLHKNGFLQCFPGCQK